ncbi:MAG TPA: hypothetical protein VFK10_06310, partial [Burkholderiaceae bacterium]|nr:hypothetical protein [Burkholderiaceae bacterium]
REEKVVRHFNTLLRFSSMPILATCVAGSCFWESAANALAVLGEPHRPGASGKAVPLRVAPQVVQ